MRNAIVPPVDTPTTRPEDHDRGGPPAAVMLLLITILLAIAADTRADTIVLKDGHEYEGTLIEAAADRIAFRRGADTETYKRADVVHVRLQRARAWDAYTQADQVGDEPLKAALARVVDPAAFPGVGAVTLLDSTTVVLKDAATWQRDERRIVRILNEHGEDESLQSVVYHREGDQVKILHGVSVRPSGELIHLRDTAVQDEALYGRNPRYDQVRRRRFALPEGKPGIVLDSALSVARTHPVGHLQFEETFLFGSWGPILEVKVAVFVPAGLPFAWQLLNDPEGLVKHQQRAADGGIWHEWRRTDAPQLIPEPLMPPLSMVVPHLEVSTAGGNWTDAAERFERVLAAADKEFPELPDVPGADVAELWGAISRNVQEVTVVPMASGLIPGDPVQTWRQGSGSELDRTYLFYRLLKRAGHQVEWVWLRPRNRGPLATDVPALQALPVPAIRIGEAENQTIMILGDDLARPEEVLASHSGAAMLTKKGLDQLPVATPDHQGVDRAVAVTLTAAGDAEVVERLTFRGDSARQLRAWRRLTAEQIANEVQQWATKSHAQARDVRFEMAGDSARNDSPLGITMRYRVSGLADIGYTLGSLQPPWLAFDARVVGRQGRHYPLFFGQTRRETVTVTIEAPKAFRLVALPESATCEGAGTALTVTSKRAGQTASAQLVYEQRGLDAPRDAYDALKACLEKRAGLGRQYWVWKRGE